MPSKRSRSQERERKQRYREKKRAGETKEHNTERKQKYDEKEENRKRIRNIRANQSEDEKRLQREKLKERMRKIRAKQSEDEKESKREEARESMAILRANKTETEKDYENLIKRKNQRKVRGSYSGKQHLESNLAAKKGMRLFTEEGRLRNFSNRESKWKKYDKKDDLKEWRRYMEKSDAHRETLEERQPDIVEKINKHITQEKEIQKLEIEKKNKIEEEMYWEDFSMSENDEPEEAVTYVTITKEQAEYFEEEERAAMIKYKKQKEKKKRQQKRENIKKALSKPLKPLPTRELCPYEKIREQIIKERELTSFKILGKQKRIWTNPETEGG